MEDYYLRDIKQWNELKLSDWKRDRLKSAVRDVEYHREELEKEIKSVEKQNKWIDQLYNSL